MSRIASLLPSATEIVCALGLEGSLVGITHECDFPPSIRQRPRLTRSMLPSGEMGSAAIDAAVQQLLREGHSPGSIYHIEAETLRAAAPDLILTQTLCDVCAVSFSQVQRAVGALGRDCRVESLEPASIEQIFASIIRVGALAGAEQRAVTLVNALRARLRQIEAAVSGASRIPRVLCVEWLDPPFGAGHWVPEQVRLAGGVEVLDRIGLPSERANWDVVLDLAPEAVILLPCGYDLEGTMLQAAATAPPPRWQSIPAVRDERVFAADGSAYFSRPGPRVVDGVELLAHALHPDRVPPPPPGRIRHLKRGETPWS